VLVLAWRNIWRQRSRSLAATIAVTFVVWMGLAYFGVLAAARDGLIVTLTESVGQLQIRARGYRDARAFRDALIPRQAQLEARLAEALPEFWIVAALEVPVLLAGEDRSRGVLLTGVRQAPALRAQFVARHLAAGRLPDEREVDGIALGRALARSLQVGLGDTVYAYAPGTEGMGASAYRVVGLLRFPEPNLEARTGMLSLRAAQDLAAPEAVSRFEVHLAHDHRAPDDTTLIEVRGHLQQVLGPEVAVETWREAYPALDTLDRIMRPMAMFFIGLFFILAGLLVVNTIYLGVIERTREFGVVIALGASRGRVMRMVLAESLVLSGIGTMIGLVLGLATLARLARGFSYPGLDEAMAQVGLPAVMYARIEPVEILIVLGFALITGMLAALWPARVAGRLAPIEAMRFVA
jgi:ABC-type lipoprotein release transport system permease subunit